MLSSEPVYVRWGRTVSPTQPTRCERAVATYASQRGASDRAIAPDPPPLPGVAGSVHQDGERLGGQRSHCPRSLI
jgi:hypothetical protein